MLFILVDSKEQSISAARQHYLTIKPRPKIEVKHIRHAAFAKAFIELINKAKPDDEILICMDYIGENALEKATKHLKSLGKIAFKIKLISYDCFDHIKVWRIGGNSLFEKNKNERRNLEKTTKEKLIPYLRLNQKLPKVDPSEETALERLWVQYRLMHAIISKSQSLSEVAEQLIKRIPLPSTPQEVGNSLKDEFLRAFRYFMLKEPDIVGGTYFREQKEEETEEETEEEVEEDNVIDQLRERIKKIAATDSNVLIQGDSGSGKESVAWAIHELSQRRAKPYRTINCAGFSDELLESELFGHEKGAFTGATKERKGILREADGGTVFLDELPDMGPKAQAKVLRLLESGEFRPVGADGGNLFVDVRIIAAGQGSLLNKPERIREDLKARIGQLTVKLFSLRELEDKSPGTLLKIANALLDRFTWATVYRGGYHILTPEDIRDYRNMLEGEEGEVKRNQLINADWQESNVRQLKNFINHWLALGEGEFARLSHRNGVSAEDSIPNSHDSSSDEVDANRPLIKHLDQLTSLGELDTFFKNGDGSKAKKKRGFIKSHAKYIYQQYLRIITDNVMNSGIITQPTKRELAGIIGIEPSTLGKYL
ncbi:MAG: sigma-54 factor interaction domain-containing protein [Desulfobulbus sp.]|nr:sigma-54 factor interaction domain-containing protein [Desulfobulbus sp.]